METSFTEVITGGLRSTYTRSSHDVTVATPPETESAPAAGHAETSNLTRHVDAASPRHAVEVTSDSFQFTDAPSTNPEPSAGVASAGTTRVTVTLPFARPASLAPTTKATSEPSSASPTPATDAEATASAVFACRTSVNVCPGPATRSSSALSEFVTHEYPTSYPLPHIKDRAASAEADCVVTLTPSLNTAVSNPLVCVLPTTSATGPIVTRNNPSTAGTVLPTTSSYVTTL